MKQLKILALAPDANPESISTSLVSYRHAEALARLHTVTLVTRSGNEPAIRRANAPFHAIEAISHPWLDRLFAWSIRRIFKNNFHNRAITPLVYPYAVAFEWRAWRRLRRRIAAGDFDVVLRVSPINTVLPSAIAFFLRGNSTPFVVGPINGGLPWPKGFSQADNQRAGIDHFRGLYRFMPFARSTYRRAKAIIAGSSNTFAEFARYRDKVFFVPENAVSPSLCSETARPALPNQKMEFIFVGNLVPYKACDLALRGSAQFLRSGSAHFSVVGDGPERKRLEQLAKSLGIESQVAFHGMLSHADAMERLRGADVLVFPSVREFGGGVVFEALAAGAVPLVADFGGPGDIVHPEIGHKVRLTNEEDVVAQIESFLAKLMSDPSLLGRLRRQGMEYARQHLTWDAKALDTTRVLLWALQQGPKPNLVPSKMSATGEGASCEYAVPQVGSSI